VRPYLRIAIVALLVSVAPLFLTGCDGEGLQINKTVTSGDNPPDQGGNNGGGNTPGTTDTRFTGSWVSSYGDDFTTAHTNRGAFEYATILRLTHSNTSITGDGYMYRFMRQGSGDAFQKYSFSVKGTASGTDAVLTLQPSQSGAFDAKPVWYLRLAGTRMTGMFQETTSSNALVRGGHALFQKVGTGSLTGSWAAAASDDYAVLGTDRLERTAVMNLAQASDNTLSGNGSFSLQRNAGSAPADFNVTRGILTRPDVDFSFGELDLGVNTLDLLGFFTGSAIVSAYGEFDNSGALLRLGHTTWYTAPEPSTAAVTHNWVTSFSDSVTSNNVPATDFLVVMNLTAQNGGGVTGSGTLRFEDDNTSLENFTIENGTLVGSRIHLEMSAVSRVLIWDLRVTGSMMLGSYRQLTPTGTFISRGVAEWRIAGTPSLKGTWTTAYFDTYGAANPENTQFALVTVSSQDANGVLTGTGGLRFAGDVSRRLFNLSGSVDSNEITWTWASQDLSGVTTWHLRQAGNFLFGTYINEDSSGGLEFRGNALWVRTNQTDVVTQ
jgi:hypothetical protein